MNENGIAWMIAGGVHAQSAEDQRQRQHRVAIAQDPALRGDTLLRLRARVAAIVGTRSVAQADHGTLSPDCCPA